MEVSLLEQRTMLQLHPSDGTVLKAEMSKYMKNAKARKRHNTHTLSDNKEIRACHQLAQKHPHTNTQIIKT